MTYIKSFQRWLREGILSGTVTGVVLAITDILFYLSFHLVDFDEAMSRGAMYRDFEAHAREASCNLLNKEVR